jgi:hypothetical protein
MVQPLRPGWSLLEEGEGRFLTTIRGPQGRPTCPRGSSGTTATVLTSVSPTTPETPSSPEVPCTRWPLPQRCGFTTAKALLTELRRDKVGFVIQGFNPVPTLTADQRNLCPSVRSATPSDHRRDEVVEARRWVSLASSEAHELGDGPVLGEASVLRRADPVDRHPPPVAAVEPHPNRLASGEDHRHGCGRAKNGTRSASISSALTPGPSPRRWVEVSNATSAELTQSSATEMNVST